MRSMGKKLKIWLICMLIFGLFVPQKVQAIDKIDEERPVSLRIEFQGKEEPITDRYHLASEESVLKMVIKNPHIDDLIKWFLKEISGSSYLTMGSQGEH